MLSSNPELDPTVELSGYSITSFPINVRNLIILVDSSGLTPHDSILVKALEEIEGLCVKVKDWRDCEISTNLGFASQEAEDSKYIVSPGDVLVIRSTCNYMYYFEEFESFLYKVKSHGIVILNEVDVVLSNLNKTYLLEDNCPDNAHILNIPTIPFEIPSSIFYTSSFYSVASVFQIMSDVYKGFDGRIVVKPPIGNSGEGVQLLNLNTEEDINLFNSLSLNNEKLLIQPCIEGIEQFGEISFILIGGKIAGAIRKIPKEGIRSNPELGSRVEVLEIPEVLQREINILIESLKLLHPFVRIDLIPNISKDMMGIPLNLVFPNITEIRGIEDTSDLLLSFLLSEIELTEPTLFFELIPKAKELFVEYIYSLCLKLDYDEYLLKNFGSTTFRIKNDIP